MNMHADTTHSALQRLTCRAAPMSVSCSASLLTTENRLYELLEWQLQAIQQLAQLSLATVEDTSFHLEALAAVGSGALEASVNSFRQWSARNTMMWY